MLHHSLSLPQMAAVTFDRNRPSGRSSCNCFSQDEYLHEPTLSAAATRLALFFQGRCTDGTGPATLKLHGDCNRSKWQVEVTLKRRRGYIIIQQHAVVCLHPRQDPWSETKLVPFDYGVRWLVDLPQWPFMFPVEAQKPVQPVTVRLCVARGGKCRLSLSCRVHVQRSRLKADPA